MKKPYPAILSAVVLSVLAASCPPPLSESIVAASEDKFKPTITVQSHSKNDYYSSSLNLSAVVRDDALASGDRKGWVSQISFEAGTTSNYKGRINIDTTGKVEQDTDFGAVKINFDASTGDLSLTADITELEESTIEVTLNAVDLNGNETERKLPLKRGDGPPVKIETETSHGNDRHFDSTSIIKVGGTISNSLAVTDSISEIKKVQFAIRSIDLDLELDLTEAGDLDPSEEGTRYEKETPRLQDGKGENAKFSLVNQAFSFEFVPPDTGMDRDFSIRVEALDKNGRSGRGLVEMIFKEDSGPYLNILKPGRGLNFYSSSAGGSSIPLKVSVTSTSDEAPVSSVKYRIGDKGTPVDIHTGEFSGTKIFDSPSISLASSLKENLEIFFTATDSRGGSTEVKRIIRDDSKPPELIRFTFESTSGDHRDYAKAGEAVTMSFTLGDDASGVDTDTLTLSIDGKNYASELAGQTGTYSVTHTLPSSSAADPSYTDSKVPFELTVNDKAGSRAVWNAGAGSLPSTFRTLTYYHEQPSVPAIAFNKIGGTSNTTYLRESDTIQAVISSSRDLDLTTSTFRFVIDGTEFAAPLTKSVSDYRAELALNSTHRSGAVTYRMHYVDKAGNEADFGGDTGKIVDQRPPVINIPLDPATPSSTTGDPVTVEVTVSDNNEVDSVTIGGTAATRAGTSNKWQRNGWRMPSSPGTLDMTVVAKDPAGNILTESHSLNVKDNDPPGIISVRGLDGTTGDPVTVRVTATDNDRVESVTIGGTAATRIRGDLWSRTWRLGSKPNTLTLEIKVTDPAGRTARKTSTLTVRDNDPPAITSGPSVVSGRATTGDPVTVEVTVSDNHGVRSVTIGGTAATKVPGTSNKWQRNGWRMPSSPGTLDMTVVAEDPAGNTRTHPHSLIVKDNDPPAITSVRGLDGTTGDRVRVVVKATDNDRVDSVTIGGTAATRIGGDLWSRTWRLGPTPNTSNLEIKVTDPAGLTAGETRTLTVRDNDPPAITLGPSVVGGSATTGDSVTVEVTVSDNHGVRSVTIGGTAATRAAGTSSKWQRTLTLPSSPGLQDMAVVAEDPAGNTRTHPYSLNVKDNDPPVLSDLKIEQPYEKGKLRNGSVDVTDNGSIVSVTVNGKAVTPPSPPGKTWTFQHTLPDTTGDHEIKVVATDGEGEKGNISKTVTVTAGP